MKSRDWRDKKISNSLTSAIKVHPTLPAHAQYATEQQVSVYSLTKWMKKRLNGMSPRHGYWHFTWFSTDTAPCEVSVKNCEVSVKGSTFGRIKQLSEADSSSAFVPNQKRLHSLIEIFYSGQLDFSPTSNVFFFCVSSIKLRLSQNERCRIMTYIQSFLD